MKNCIMKSLLLAIFALCGAVSATAQDKIITKEGDVIEGWEVEVSRKSITYRETAAEDAPIKRLDRAMVLMVKYADGTKEMIDGDNATAAPAAATTPAAATPAAKPAAKPAAPYVPSAEAKKRNEAFITQINNAKPDFSTGSKVGKSTSAAYFVFGMKPNSQLITDDVELSFRMESKTANTNSYTNFARYPLCTATMKNNSDKTIYIQMGNSFIVRNGESEAFSMLSTSMSTTSNAPSASMGQQVVAIPAGMSKSFEFLLFTNNAFKDVKGLRLDNKAGTIAPIFYTTKKLKSGEFHNYTAEGSPLSWSILLNYSHDERFSEVRSLAANMYLSSIVGVSYNIWTATNILPNTDNCITWLSWGSFNIFKGWTSDQVFPIN